LSTGYLILKIQERNYVQRASVSFPSQSKKTQKENVAIFVGTKEGKCSESTYKLIIK
jgi:hypothetical protein